MKTLKNIFAFVALSATMILSACDKGPEGGENNNGGGSTAGELSIEITTGTAAETSLTFTVTTVNADKALWWVHPTLDKVANGDLDMAAGTEIEVGEAVDVTAYDLNHSTSYTIYVYAESGDKTLYKKATMSTAKPGEGPAAPKIAIDSNTLTAETVSVWITCDKNCDAAWYLLLPGDQTATAAQVKEQGVAISDADIAYGEKLVEIDGLTPKTVYNLYAAAERDGVLGLSKVYNFLTKEVDIFAYFNGVTTAGPSSFEKNQFLVTFTVVDSETGAQLNDDTLALHFMDTNDYGFLGGEYIPLSINSVTGEETSLFAFIPDAGYSNFIYNGVGYEFLMPEEGDANNYYVKISGGMLIGEDNNQVDIRLPYQDADGNKFVLEGKYTGPLNYSGNSGAQTADRDNCYLFNKMTASWDGNVVTLFSSSITAGSLTLVLDTKDGVLASAEESKFYSVEDGTLNVEKSCHVEYATGMDDKDWVFTFTQGGLTFERLADKDGKERYLLTLPRKENPKALKSLMTDPKQLILTYVNNEIEQWIVTIGPQEDDPTLN